MATPVLTGSPSKRAEMRLLLTQKQEPCDQFKAFKKAGDKIHLPILRHRIDQVEAKFIALQGGKA